jgi:lipocalin
VRARLQVIVPSDTASSKLNPVSTHSLSAYHSKWYPVARSISLESQSIAPKTSPDVRGSSLVNDTHVLITFSPDSTLRVKVLEVSLYTRSFLKQRTDMAVVR